MSSLPGEALWAAAGAAQTGSRQAAMAAAARRTSMTSVDPPPHHSLADGCLTTSPAMGIRAVIFDMDGVLLDSEAAWDAAREAYTRESGGSWSESAQRDMMGMSSTEWSRYMHEELGVPADPEQISADVVDRMLAGYHERLPLIDGAVDAV